jgi:hypothetical protein
VGLSCFELEQEEYRSSGVQEFRSSGVQENPEFIESDERGLERTLCEFGYSSAEAAVVVKRA